MNETMIPAWVDGILTPVEKLRAHREGLKHKAVSVFVLRDGQTLMQRRAPGKYHTPGLWTNSCCTHPDWGETALDCARRRLKQELGITGLTPEFRQHLEYRADVGNGLVEHEAVDIFIAHADAGLTLDPDPQEVSETRWITLPRLMDEIAQEPDQFTPWLKIYLADHGDSIFGATLTQGART